MFSQISHFRRSWARRQRFKILHHLKFSLPLRPHEAYRYDLAHPHVNGHASLELSYVLSWPLMHAHIYTRRRKQSVAHKSGRKFFNIDVREIRKSLC
ncbi:Bgt-20973 [Blumeria graminis f. sp. tritici]|uniref:Bgt-20973 n=1 Tax=Blumeria graminis f. sp. tritici TaxID=62690 RepID=A0A9X9MJJ9_BLUGR|nr:Bgt-20973 [Blumeria graminis f. sp. tritici]